MCGICGVVSADPSYPVSEATLNAMRDSLAHRGPDDAGMYVAPGIALGSRRLAILDLSQNGHMPMSTPDLRYRITYNGEVYNYRDLRSKLVASGQVFRSNTDTEVVLSLFSQEGPAMLDRLNGMFAFAIWDAQDRSLFLARDRLGVKPLYYAFQEDRLYFASEEKALFAAGVPSEFDQDTWEELLCFRYVAGERTPFVGVRRLLPGHYLLWRNGRSQIRRWWNLADKVRSRCSSPVQDPVAWYREIFDSAVGLRRISDVPIGVLLSGGLDSSSVAASLAHQAGRGIASFTVRFDDPEYDEGPLARLIAQRWSLDAHELTLGPADLMERLRRASWLNDQPLAHGNDLYLWAIAEYAKPRVTVLLSGEGADETLGGYVRYRFLPYASTLKRAGRILRWASAWKSNNRLAKLNRFLSLDSVDGCVLFNACDVLPADLARIGFRSTQGFPFRERMLAEAKDLYPGEPMRQAMSNDQHTFLCSILDRNDRMTMGASIECRVPFLDYRLVEGLAALPSSGFLARMRSKVLLRKAVGDRLPPAVLRHRKWGFGVPWSRYLRGIPEFREIVGRLHVLEPVRSGPFSTRQIETLAKEFLEGQNGNDALIRQLFMITIWHEVCVQERAAVATRT